ncbi:hypothetical protein D9M69_727260 [compost metagenome]
MHHLHESVHAGIGASGTQRADFVERCEFGQSPFQPVLHRAAAGLTLPAVVGMTVVADPQRDTHRRRFMG